jgi:hypothetical protein
MPAAGTTEKEKRITTFGTPVGDGVCVGDAVIVEVPVAVADAEEVALEDPVADALPDAVPVADEVPVSEPVDVRLAVDVCVAVAVALLVAVAEAVIVLLGATTQDALAPAPVHVAHTLPHVQRVLPAADVELPGHATHCTLAPSADAWKKLAPQAQ